MGHDIRVPLKDTGALLNTPITHFTVAWKNMANFYVFDSINQQDNNCDRDW
jgi:hypothetical protein